LKAMALAAGKGTVGTVGEIEVEPGIINVIASRVRFSLDVRGPDEDAFHGVVRDIGTFEPRSDWAEMFPRLIDEQRPDVVVVSSGT